MKPTNVTSSRAVLTEALASLNGSPIVQGKQLAPEVEEGNREYKLMLTNLTYEQLTHRVTQLNWRLNEGNGEAFYLVGVEDNGNQLGLTEAEMTETLLNLQHMANQVGCEMTVKQMFAGTRGKTAEVSGWYECKSCSEFVFKSIQWLKGTETCGFRYLC